MSTESNNLIDRYFDAFAERMFPDDDGEPVVPIEDLGIVLKALDVSQDSVPDLARLMDPENTGYITFERFVKVCDDTFETKASIHKAGKHSDSDEGAGFIVDDDSSDVSYKEESGHEDRSEESEEEKRSARERKRPADSTSDTETSISPSMAFNVLSQGQDRITVDSLAYVSRMINANASQDDLRKMVELVSSKEDFFKLWK